MSIPRVSRLEAGVPFILVTVFLDVLTLGVAIPVLPELVKELSGGHLGNASAWLGMIIGAFALMQFLCAPLLGALSDRFGRRPVLLLSTLGAALDHLLIAFAPGIGWLLVARMIAGATASNITAANAYVADVTPPERRARNFGLVGAAFGFGFIAGPAVGGLLGEVSPRLPFLVAAGLAGCNFLYGLLVLPESLKPENRRPFALARANPLGSLGLFRGTPLLFGLAVADVCVMLAFGVLQTVWVLHTGERFGWSAVDNDLSLTAIGLATAVVQGGIVGLVVARVGDRAAVVGGLAVMAVAYAIYGLATIGALFYVAIAVHALGGVSGPALQGILSKAVGPDRQGALQGALASLHSLIFIVAPLIGAALFSLSTGPTATVTLPGLPFYFGAAIIAVGVVAARRVLARAPDPPATPAAQEAS